MEASPLKTRKLHFKTIQILKLLLNKKVLVKIEENLLF